MPFPWHTAKNGQFVVCQDRAHDELDIHGWPNGHFAVYLVPGTRQSDQTNPIFFCFSRIKDPISQHIYHRHYISHIYHNKHHRYYISQLATNNIKHIQKSNAKSCKFTTYPEVHKSINIEINKFMAVVGR